MTRLGPYFLLILLTQAWVATTTLAVAAVAQDAWPDSTDPAGVTIDEETLDGLTAILSAPPDVNVAGVADFAGLPGFSLTDARLLVARRREAGRFHSVRDAAATAGLTPAAAESLLNLAKCAGDGKTAWAIGVRAASSWHSRRLQYAMPVNRAPDSVITFDATWLGEWRAGFALLMRPGVSAMHAADSGGATGLVGTGPTIVFDPSGFHLTWSRGALKVIAGTFQAGFATGLTMDTTGLKRPRGIQPYNSLSVMADTGSIRRSRRFSGVAAAFEVPFATGAFSVSGTVFGSYSFMDPSGTEVTWDRCPAGDPECGDSDMAPFLEWDDPLAADPPSSSMTLTNILREGTAGANIGFGSAAWRVEATGWATGLRYRPDAPGMKAAVSSPMPEDRRIFGAAGVAGSATLPGDGLFLAELSVNDRGAVAAVAEAAYSPVPGLDIEPSVRYYPAGWDNPWTGAIADSSELGGNRARNETGGRIDLTWRSSTFTRSRFRLDAAWHDRDDTSGSLAHLDIEAATALEIFASSNERLRFGFGYRDRDVTRGGRALSWEPYFSQAAGNLSGGCRIDWTFFVSTTRIPRTRLALWIRQAFVDAATLPDRFDIDMAATLRLDAALAPGPDMFAFFRWSDESMAADPTPSAAQGCTSGATTGFLPAQCRGDSRLDAGLGLVQQIHLKKSSIRFGFQFRYTRHVDDRLSWTAGEPAPTGRNDFAGTLDIELGFASGGSVGH